MVKIDKLRIDMLSNPAVGQPAGMYKIPFVWVN
jgi:hypothetical protein